MDKKSITISISITSCFVAIFSICTLCPSLFQCLVYGSWSILSTRRQCIVFKTMQTTARRYRTLYLKFLIVGFIHNRTSRGTCRGICIGIRLILNGCSLGICLAFRIHVRLSCWIILFIQYSGSRLYRCFATRITKNLYRVGIP